MHIIEGGFEDPRVVELLEIHRERAVAETAHGTSMANHLVYSALLEPGLTFWSAWEDHTRMTLVAIGALKELTSAHGELKSMHVAKERRGRGYGAELLRHIITSARTRGMNRLSLETGSWPYFAPARALYARHGFVECAPFGDYRPDPNSVFMTLAL